MLEQRIYTPKEIDQIWSYAMKNDNTQAAIEAKDHGKVWGKVVKIVKGRKNIGFVGQVFWLTRKHYGRNQWFGYQTRIGIKGENNEVVWTSVENIEVIAHA